MFYTESQLQNAIKCQRCDKPLQEFDTPRMLPCFKTICNKCVLQIDNMLNENNEFACIICSNQHTKPLDGFPVNDLVYSLIETQPKEISRGREAKLFKTSLNNLEELLNKLNSDKQAQIDKIKEYCSELRKTVEVAVEKRIQQINDCKENLLEEIDDYEQDSIEKYILNEELIKQINEYLENKKNFSREIEIDEDELLEEHDKLKILKLDLEKEFSLLKTINENGEFMKFQVNENEIDDELIGIFHFKYLNAPFSEIVSCSNDETIKIWGIESGKCIKTLKGHSGEVTCVKTITDNIIASGSDDKTIKIWNVETGACELTLEGHDEQVNDIELLTEDRIVSISNDFIKIWDINKGICLLTILSEAQDWVKCIIKLDENTIATGADKSIKIWNTITGECTMHIKNAHTNNVEALLKINDTLICSSSDKDVIKVWNITTGECLNTLEGHSYGISCLEKISDELIVSCSFDDTIKIWNLRTNECLRTIKAHSNSVNCVKYISNNKIISCSDDKTLKIWNLETGECLDTLKEHFAKVNWIQLI